jgi:spermidine synthase
VSDSSRERAGRTLVYVCLFLSGLSALVYEVAWMRQVRLTVGATTAAVSTVLAVYMGGLAAGAWLFGRMADRSRAPLRLYGYLEAGIGLYALLLPQLLQWSTPGYVALARQAAGHPTLLVLLRIALAALILLAPTILMGGTLPVLVRFVGRSPSRFGRDLGALYGTNLAGAVTGTVAAGFVLVPGLGLHGATVLAAALNLAIGAVCIARSAAATPALATGPAVADAVAPPPAVSSGLLTAGTASLLRAVVFASGFTSMGYEVLWTRILLFSFTSTVQAFAVILATFLLGLALGSALFAWAETRYDRLRTLAAAQSLAGVLSLLFVPASLRAMDILQVFANAQQGERGAVIAMALAAGAVILIPATLMGVVFPLASRLLTQDLASAGRRIGNAYTLNTAGGVLGSLATGFLLIPALGLKRSLLFLAAAQVALGCVLVLRAGWPARRARALVAAWTAGLLAALAAPAVLLRGPNPFDHVPASSIEAHRDDVTASVSVVLNEHGKALRIDGFEAAAAGPPPGGATVPDEAEPESGYMGLMTHIPMLLHPGPQRLLVICFGTGTTAGAGLAHPGAQIDVVDINRSVFAFADHFAAANRGVAHDPRARLIVDDGRNYLLTTTRTYDVITSEPMPPRFAGVSSLYSREYYQLARRRLAPGGLLAQWLPFHLVSVAEARSILRTVQEVFPETTLWVHYGTGVIVARRDGPILLEPDALRRRIQASPLGADLARFQVHGMEEFLDLFMLSPAGVRRLSQGAALVTDDRPFLEFHASPYRSGFHFVGTLSASQAAALELVYRVAAEDPLPLDGAGAEAALLAERRTVSSRGQLATLLVQSGLPDEARAELELGRAHARTPQGRAYFEGKLSKLDQGTR